MHKCERYLCKVFLAFNNAERINKGKANCIGGWNFAASKKHFQDIQRRSTKIKEYIKLREKVDKFFRDKYNTKLEDIAT